MKQLGPKSIRGKVTLMAGVATAVAMALIVVVMSFAMRAVLEQAVADSLHERLEQARELVEAGDYARAADGAGNEIIQIIDENGKVVAGSRNAHGLAAIVATVSGEAGQVADLVFSREATGPTDEASAASDAAAQGDAQAIAPSTPDAGAAAPAAAAGSTAETRKGTKDDDADEADVDEAGDTADNDDSDDNDNDDDADDDDDDDNDADDADDDGDDNDNDRKGKSTLSKQAVSDAGVGSAAHGQGAHLAWPARQLAWADEPSVDAGHVDARTILGVEGPYLILRETAESPDGPMTIVAVTSLASAVASAQRSAWLLAAIMVAVLVAVVAFAWMLTGRTLRPVEAMRAQAATITAENLGQRIDVPPSDKDLARLAETLNDMLGRIERSLEQEKRFISDASHELKSPVAATAIILDTLRAYPDDLDVSEALDDLAGENARMASIVGDMLTLTRYDEGRLQCNLEPIDLMDLVLEEAMALQTRVSCKVDTADVEPVVCRADSDLLSHALRNLLENAARYAKTVVKVSCAQEGDTVAITVSDDGCGIAPEDRERVFGRFVCLDERSGTGLGLAVVESAIAAHAGSVSFTDPELSGATARIELPA